MPPDFALGKIGGRLFSGKTAGMDVLPAFKASLF